VAIAGANATLHLGQDYYFLDASDAKIVLTEIWGNPPSAVTDVLGMILPSGKSPVDDTWGAVITYVGDGYVSDADAHKIDADKLLDQIREGEDEDNRQRAAAGFETSHLVGWAQPPSYNPVLHNLIWAKSVSFGSSPDQTLNYDIRVLGRAGVLSMNIVAGMDDLATVGTDAKALMGTATFDQGARYQDYEAGVDKKAEYGVAGLIAGGLAVAVAKKVGLIGILLLILKKGAVVVLAALAGVGAWFKRLVTGRKSNDVPSLGADIPLTGTRTKDEPEDLSPYPQLPEPDDTKPV
jgi:uncharacterized membrane-anchored protein